jgi:uncharacterized membrane protein HdeD (DUF308 family)
MSDLARRPPGLFSAGANLDAMSATLARNWWAVALRGAIGIIFGVVALLLPGLTIASLVLLFAIYMLADGVCDIVSAVRAASAHGRWGLLLFEGIIDILAGVAALLVPGITVVFFVTLLCVWSIVSGVAMTMAGFRLHATHGRWLLLLSGLVSVLWGALLLVSPISGAVVLTWWLGAYALIFGVMLLVLGFRLRSRHTASPTAPGVVGG